MNPLPSPTFAPDSPYRRLAASLDSLPNRFPHAPDDSDLRLLAWLFTPEQAGLAASLLPELETPTQISQRLGRDAQETTILLKEMSLKGLVATGKTEAGRLGFGLLPFVVGIYENQNERMDSEMARLFEDYFQHAFGRALEIKPQVHRVVPVQESIPNTMEIQPFESVSNLIDRSQAWGVIDCICRKQKALIGQACKHPVDVCLIFAGTPDAFAGSTTVRPLTRQGAYQTLRRAAQAGLVHCVSNNQNNVWYICNCCTCSCGVLRGMVDLGIANVVASSPFINRVDENLCTGCGECLDSCQFNALTVDGVAHVQAVRCAGCGVCVQFCQQGALHLERRPDESTPPASEEEWRSARRSTLPAK
jgi:Na+-translocating ferredoxin:NAD+ oxidoreductase subunit B